MKRSHGRVVNVESLADLDRRLAAGATELGSWRVHRLDLRERAPALFAHDVRGTAFLGCTFADGDDDALAAAGALVLPDVGRSPLDVYRPHLYTAEELYDREPYARSLDARAYAWAQRVPDRDDSLAAALHDHAIDDALGRFTTESGRRVVGVMGGHALQRGSTGYADAARLGRLLAAGGALVATGGGPGAMEAANLGARLAGATEDDLAAALAAVADVPSFRPSIDAWAARAREAVADLPADDSLGIPTWFYGHEPPNVFATAIAKYVRNPAREAVLLEICDGGIVFLPGAAGTVQEVFQDGCENYYADEASVAPMVLVDRTHWTETLPAWPLLQALARGRGMEQHVHLVDTVDEAAAILGAFRGSGAPA
ncbi:LOG family protein [Nocardioides litoris]|uniref:LOG family protein n=1 Tax=Nocardioides litoris TaxID=1926648 RepID=UPI00111D66A9|nr:Rossmann fold nucleotide-binding protein [Nocardioides litoris]